MKIHVVLQNTELIIWNRTEVPCGNFFSYMCEDVHVGKKIDFFMLLCTAYTSEQAHCFTSIVQGEQWE